MLWGTWRLVFTKELPSWRLTFALLWPILPPLLLIGIVMRLVGGEDFGRPVPMGGECDYCKRNDPIRDEAKALLRGDLCPQMDDAAAGWILATKLARLAIEAVDEHHATCSHYDPKSEKRKSQ